MPEHGQDRDLAEFFAIFEEASDSLDTGALTGCFAESFMAADPSGAQPVPRSGFLSVLPGRKELFTAAGIGRVSLADLTHIDLDEHYLLVRTRWAAQRQGGSAGSGSVTLRSSFILRRTDGGLRIVFYLNHKDLNDILRPDGAAAN